VPADRGPADLEAVGDLSGGQRLSAQHQQDAAPHRVGDRLRHVVHG
jgi:hypothetical protein